MPQSELMRDGEQMMTVCNACRYCEGFCAVWPAMEFRRKFAEGDLNYLANLCHNCSECYYACQYAPPHEWEVNPPQTFAKLRAQSYEQYAWPKALASAFRANALVVSLAAALMLVVFLFGVTQAREGSSLSPPSQGEISTRLRRTRSWYWPSAQPDCLRHWRCWLGWSAFGVRLASRSPT